MICASQRRPFLPPSIIVAIRAHVVETDAVVVFFFRSTVWRTLVFIDRKGLKQPGGVVLGDDVGRSRNGRLRGPLYSSMIGSILHHELFCAFFYVKLAPSQ